jgi:tetratricopeptide (TPR) repeat protein
LCLAGRLEPALAECDQAEALDPELAETYWYRALIRARLGGDKADIERDIEQFARLTRSRGRLPTLLLRFDVMLSGAARRYAPEERTALMEEILLRDPERHEVRTQLAHERFDGGLVDEALAQLEKAHDIQPNYLPARLSKAEILRRIGRVEEAGRIAGEILADERFPELLSRKPEAIRTYHMAALGRAYAGAWQEALALARTGVARSARIKPEELRGESYYALAVVLAGASRADPPREAEAVSCLREALRLNPDCRAWFEVERCVGDRARIARLISDATGPGY